MCRNSSDCVRCRATTVGPSHSWHSTLNVASRVKNLKRSLGLTQPQASQQVPEHVTFGWLQTRWTSDHHNEPLHRSAHVAIARRKLAMELGVCDRTLELHMKNLDFNCMNPYTDDEVGACLRTVPDRASFRPESTVVTSAVEILCCVCAERWAREPVPARREHVVPTD